MMISDDQGIKAEIENISRRIDHIIKTVNRFIPDRNFSECSEASGTADDESRIHKITEQSTQKAE
jgi:hypothetical protein